MGYGTRWVLGVGIPGEYYPATLHRARKTHDSEAGPGSTCRVLEWVVMGLDACTGGWTVIPHPAGPVLPLQGTPWE